MNTDRRARLSETFARYAVEVRDRAAIIADTLTKAAPDAKLLSLHAHTLAGSGATMGAEDISTLGRAIEDITLRLTEAARPPNPAELAELAALSQRLSQAAEAFDAEASLDAFLAKIYPQG